MPIATKKQIRDSVISTTNQLASQIGTIVDDFINITLQEIGSPAWAFDKPVYHLWSWLKRKTTFTTTSGTEDYVMERDVDKIGILRQLNTPAKLDYVSDEIFFREIPDPDTSGNPLIYRLWEIDGLSTRLAAADLIDIISSSNSDGTSFSAVVIGYISGRLESNTYILNGTTVVSGTKTFDAREIFVSKSAKTTGNITFRRNSNSVTLVVLGAEEISPRFKVITLYPKPNATITMYLEYYKRIRELFSDTDVPEFDGKWHHIVRMGTLAKVYQYLGKTSDFIVMQALYEKMVRAMIADDRTKSDALTELRRFTPRISSGIRLHRSEDVVA